MLLFTNSPEETIITYRNYLALLVAKYLLPLKASIQKEDNKIEIFALP